MYPTRRSGAVAQMGERCNRTAEVRGSIPLSSTSRSKPCEGLALAAQGRRIGETRVLGRLIVSSGSRAISGEKISRSAPMYRKILLPIDITEPEMTERAISVAQELAKAFDSDMRVVNLNRSCPSLFSTTCPKISTSRCVAAWRRK